MFDITQAFGFGRTISAYGQMWQVVYSCGYGYYLVIKPGTDLPCPVMLVEEDKAVEPDTTQ